MSRAVRIIVCVIKKLNAMVLKVKVLVYLSYKLLHIVSLINYKVVVSISLI